MSWTIWLKKLLARAIYAALGVAVAALIAAMEGAKLPLWAAAIAPLVMLALQQASNALKHLGQAP